MKRLPVMVWTSLILLIALRIPVYAVSSDEIRGNMVFVTGSVFIKAKKSGSRAGEA